MDDFPYPTASFGLSEVLLSLEIVALPPSVWLDAEEEPTPAR